MTRCKVCFVAQNETHAESFVHVVESLLSYGVHEESVECIALDNVTGLAVEQIIPSRFRKEIPVKYAVEFYRRNSVIRAVWLLINRHAIRRAMKDVSLLVFGNDGAIQRLMAQAVRANGGVVLLVIDGLIQPWPTSGVRRWGARAKRMLFTLAERLGASAFVPSHVGHSSVDHIYVMDGSVEKALRGQGVLTPISVVRLPRLKAVEIGSEAAEDFGGGSYNLLYVTGAYAWHGLRLEERMQIADVQAFLDFARQHDECSFRVRIHPREKMDGYSCLNLPANVTLTCSELPPLQDLQWATCVVTARSTMAFEAKMMGKPVCIFTKNFPVPEQGSVFADDPYYLLTDNLEDLFKRRDLPVGCAAGSGEDDCRLSQDIHDHMRRAG